MRERLIMYATWFAFLLLNFASFATSEFNPLFWEAGYTDDDFNHNPCFKKELAAALCTKQDCVAAIMGVAGGEDVFEMVEAGFSVIAVEPLPVFVDNLVEEAVRKDVLDKITLHKAAAGFEVGSVVIRYNNVTLSSLGLTVDNLVKKPIEVLSVDVHGDANNYDVILGAKKAIENEFVKSIWVEFKAEPWAQSVVDFLVEHGFELYDFKWIGTDKSCRTKRIPISRCKLRKVYDGVRPTTENYVSTMYEVKGEDFQWLQTDIVGIHKSVLTDSLTELLRTLTQRCPPADQTFPM